MKRWKKRRGGRRRIVSRKKIHHFGKPKVTRKEKSLEGKERDRIDQGRMRDRMREREKRSERERERRHSRLVVL